MLVIVKCGFLVRRKSWVALWAKTLAVLPSLLVNRLNWGLKELTDMPHRYPSQQTSHLGPEPWYFLGAVLDSPLMREDGQTIMHSSLIIGHEDRFRRSDNDTLHAGNSSNGSLQDVDSASHCRLDNDVAKRPCLPDSTPSQSSSMLS